MCQSVVGDNVRLNDVPLFRDESLDWHKMFGSLTVSIYHRFGSIYEVSVIGTVSGGSHYNYTTITDQLSYKFESQSAPGFMHSSYDSVGVVFEVIDGRVLQLLGKSVSQDMSYDVRGMFVRVYA